MSGCSVCGKEEKSGQIYNDQLAITITFSWVQFQMERIIFQYL